MSDETPYTEWARGRANYFAGVADRGEKHARGVYDGEKMRGELGLIHDLEELIAVSATVDAAALRAWLEGRHSP